MKLRIFITATIMLISFSQLWAVPSVALFSVQSRSDSINSLIIESERIIRTTVKSFGRLELVETNTLIRAGSSITLSDVVPDRYFSISQQAGADATILFSIHQAGVVSYGELIIEPHNQLLSGYARRIRVESKILRNIPYLLQRELIKLHKEMPIFYKQIEIGDNWSVINAGTYSGLQTGSEYRTGNGSRIMVETAGRYESYVVIRNAIDQQDSITLYANTDEPLKQCNKIIKANIKRRYGAAENYSKRREPVKQYLESLIIVNPLGNVLLPGYGSYINTRYMGFESPHPSSVNMIYTASLYLTALLYVPVKTRFDGNFFPWVQDSDKSDKVLRRQQFLWTMIPLTFTVSYLDHLAIQYRKDSVLPPGFFHAATPYVHSLFIPGGGHFYRGDRVSGWSYYAAESAAFYFAFTAESDKERSMALYSLGGLKVLEFAHLLFTKSSFDFYHKEFDSSSTTSFISSLGADVNGGPMIMAGAQLKF
ncbi:MAG: hypothetical protein PF637_12585 [Spirochaetes bacterium]|jgi:hypothetical protein|nr:hypothetical protein [Spirochaetota bacterium]